MKLVISCSLRDTIAVTRIDNDHSSKRLSERGGVSPLKISIFNFWNIVIKLVCSYLEFSVIIRVKWKPENVFESRRVWA